MTAMQSYQNIKDQMQGGVQKMNQQKNNPLPPRGMPTKSDSGKSPNYKQDSKSEYDYEIDEDRSPFSKNSQQSKGQSQRVGNSNSNNNNIYNSKSSSNARNNTAQHPYRQPSRDNFDDAEDDGYDNKKYSVQNYTNQSKKPATTSSAYQKGSRNADLQNNNSKEDTLYTNQDEYEQYSKKQTQKKGSVSGALQKHSYQNEDEEEEDNTANERIAQNKRASSANRRDSDGGQKVNTRMIQRYQKLEEGLMECPQGCGRTFNEDALEKHEKVCKKVFQDKRKAFDITQKRQVVPVNQQIQQDDEQKRADIIKRQKEMHECPDCGRTFRYDVFEKHIKICVKVFTKKNRENSLNRKASLNTTGSNQPTGPSTQQQGSNYSKLPPTQLQKKGSSIQNEAESDPKNMKKPPLKRNPSQNEKKEEEGKRNAPQRGGEWDETPVGGSKSKNTWEDTPVGGKSSQNAWDEFPVGAQNSKNKNQWEDTPVGGGDKSKTQQWDEYPSSSSQQSIQSKGGKSTSAQSEVSNNPWDNKPKGKQILKPVQKRPEWNDDWNSQQQDDQDDFASKNREYELKEKQKQEQQQKNYNFNKKLKSVQSGSKYSIENPSESNFANNNEYDEEQFNQEEQYVYSKPNIGKKIINSAKKSPAIESKKMQKPPAFSQREEEGEDEYDQPPVRNTRNPVNKNVKQPLNNKQNGYDNHQREVEEDSSQYSKPFLKKNQGNIAVSKGKPVQQQPPKANTFNPPNNVSDALDIPIVKNNDFNKQLLEMEYEAQEQEQFECPEGCGRKFAEAVLEKHIRICQKVFQKKRKVFNSAAQRAKDEEGAGGSVIPQYTAPVKKAPPPKKNIPVYSKYDDDDDDQMPSYGQKPNKQQASKPPQQPQNKKQFDENTKIGKKQAKWKQQSDMLRAGMRAARGVTTHSEYDQKILKEASANDDYVQCKFCNRKFNDKAAEKHIPFCEKKSQQNQIKQGGKAKLNLTTQKSSTPSNRKY